MFGTLHFDILLLCCVAAVGHAVKSRPIDYVDPFIGSGGFGFGAGSAAPGPQWPWGAVRLSPDTDSEIYLPFQHCGGFAYDDTHISAFSHTRLVGAGVPDLGNFGLMLTRGANGTSCWTRECYHAPYNASAATARVGYYSTLLPDRGALVELATPGTLAGLTQFTVTNAGSNSTELLFDVCHNAMPDVASACKLAALSNFTQIASQLRGSSSYESFFTGYIRMAGSLSQRSPQGGLDMWMHVRVLVQSGSGSALSSPQMYAWENGTAVPATARQTSSGSLGAWLHIPAQQDVSSLIITVHTGLSYISPAHAVANLYEQAAAGGHWATIPEAEQAVAQATSNVLDRVAVELPSNTQHVDEVLTKLYTALYRASLSPTKYTESGNVYQGMDGAAHSIQPGRDYLSDMSLWDTHRTHAPLLNLLAPDVARDAVESLLAQAAASDGTIPRWPLATVRTGCMIGAHGTVVVADSMLKLVPGVFSNSSAACSVALTTIEAQISAQFAQLGYIPQDQDSTAVSKTLAVAMDAGIALQWAARTGIAAPPLLSSVAVAYQRVWNSSTQLMCPRYSDGQGECPALPELPYPIPTGYTEGNAWQWAWATAANITAGARLYDNTSVYIARLQELMSGSVAWTQSIGNVLPNPYYWAGNEPDIMFPWLFNVAGWQASKNTQFWTRWLAQQGAYSTAPDGLPGNDDYGTLSAWLVWASLGLYPIAGTSSYAIGSPIISAANITLPTPLRSMLPGNGNAPVVQLIVHNASAVTFSAQSPAKQFSVAQWTEVMRQVWTKGTEQQFAEALQAEDVHTSMHSVQFSVLQAAAERMGAFSDEASGYVMPSILSGNAFVRAASIGGVPLSKPFITHEQLLGNVLEIWMTDQPEV